MGSREVTVTALKITFSRDIPRYDLQNIFHITVLNSYGYAFMSKGYCTGQNETGFQRYFPFVMPLTDVRHIDLSPIKKAGLLPDS
jgi:hypothetical protein